MFEKNQPQPFWYAMFLQLFLLTCGIGMILEGLMRRQGILRDYKISDVELQDQFVLGSIIRQKLVGAYIDCFSFNVQDKAVFRCVKHFEVNTAAFVDFCFEFHCFRNIHCSSSLGQAALMDE